MTQKTLLTILPFLLLSLTTGAQRKLTWNFNKPNNEKVDSVLIEMKDAAYKTILKDSFALSGTRTDIPFLPSCQANLSSTQTSTAI